MSGSDQYTTKDSQENIVEAHCITLLITSKLIWSIYVADSINSKMQDISATYSSTEHKISSQDIQHPCIVEL